MRSLDGPTAVNPDHPGLRPFDQVVQRIRSLTRPGETVLDLTSASLLYVASGRRGPGFHDIVMPASFLDEDEERSFVARLERSPPALVISSPEPFDGMASRAVEAHAPLLARWVAANYEVRERLGPYVLRTPVSRWPAGAPGSGG